jgi:hypothetical protein
MFCSSCGQPLPDPKSRFCPGCGRPATAAGAQTSSTPPRIPEPLEQAAKAARRTAEGAGRGVQAVLEDPRVLQHVPGRSLPLLGAGLVVLAILLSVLPILSGIGLQWSVVMLAGSMLVIARELRTAGRQVPAALAAVVNVAEHPAFLPSFTALTCAHAFLELGLGLVPLLWLLAAVVLGYYQWRASEALRASERTLPHTPAERNLRLWVLVGALVCAGALFLPWRSSAASHTEGIRLKYIDESTDRFDEIPFKGSYMPKWDPLLSYRPGYVLSGRARPLAILAVLALAATVVLTRLRQARAALPSFTLPVLAVGLTLWGLSGLSFSGVGSWIFLLGAVAMDVAVSRDLFPQRDDGAAPPPGGDSGMG